MLNRADRHCYNATEVAKFLSLHPKVNWVRYPGLSIHPQQELASKQMNKFGGIITFEIKGRRNVGEKLMNNLSLFNISSTSWR
jgi:cystathionine beta-lyase/cystathionine gamma-synthase